MLAGKKLQFRKSLMHNQSKHALQINFNLNILAKQIIPKIKFMKKASIHKIYII